MTALQYLCRSDPGLRPALREAPAIRRPRKVDLYHDLLESIISQQLSVKAAATIFDRFCALFPEGCPEAALLTRLSLPRLRTVGVSRQKAGYLKNVAKYALRHDLSARALRKRMEEIAGRWRPHRTLACRQLWRWRRTVAA
jgi:DNA-3-methyladenine glycosylase II